MINKPVILCVDDEKMILDSLKVQLKNNFSDQFYYESAENAEDALELIEELVQDGLNILMIVSDWLMPGIKGDEFLIMVHHKYPKIINIMLTGQADCQAVEKAQQEANLLKCISKPWNEKELVETIILAMEKI